MSRLWRAQVTLEQLQRSCLQTMCDNLGMQITELGEDFLRGTMPVDQRTCQPMRLLHGGASLALAETLASLAANAVVDQALFICLGQEINANHLRRVLEGSTVTGTVRAFYIGVRSQVWGVELCDEQGRRTCVSRVTMAVVRR
jgi:1,4-dihydroxy-2-naphthoyl-CoA hydrolase